MSNGKCPCENVQGKMSKGNVHGNVQKECPGGMFMGISKGMSRRRSRGNVHVKCPGGKCQREIFVGMSKGNVQGECLGEYPK